MDFDSRLTQRNNKTSMIFFYLRFDFMSFYKIKMYFTLSEKFLFGKNYLNNEKAFKQSRERFYKFNWGFNIQTIKTSFFHDKLTREFIFFSSPDFIHFERISFVSWKTDNKFLIHVLFSFKFCLSEFRYSSFSVSQNLYNFCHILLKTFCQFTEVFKIIFK